MRALYEQWRREGLDPGDAFALAIACFTLFFCLPILGVYLWDWVG